MRYWGSSPALETPVNCHSDLMEDPLWNIEPVQLGVKQICQASVELPSMTDETVLYCDIALSAK